MAEASSKGRKSAIGKCGGGHAYGNPKGDVINIAAIGAAEESVSVRDVVELSPKGYSGRNSCSGCELAGIARYGAEEIFSGTKPPV